MLTWTVLSNSSDTPLQAASVKPAQNGTAAPPQAAKPSQAVVTPTSLPDPSVAISLAVTQINAGKLDEADKLLSGIISETDKRTPNLGAHVARGTARALRRELQGASNPTGNLYCQQA